MYTNLERDREYIIIIPKCSSMTIDWFMTEALMDISVPNQPQTEV